MVMLEDSVRRNQLEQEIMERLNTRLRGFLAPFPPDSLYAKNLTNHRLAKDLLENVIQKEFFIYSFNDEEDIYLRYKGETWKFNTQIKKLIKEALISLGYNPSKNRIGEIFNLILLDISIDREKIDLLEKYLITKNLYIFDREMGIMLPRTYKNAKFFYDLFRDNLIHNERVIRNLSILEKAIQEGEIQEDQDLKGNMEMDELWETLIGAIPFPIQIPVEYDPEAKAPRWEQFLKEVIDEKYHTAIKRFIGYALYPGILSNVPNTCVLLGEGANGKSVFIKAIQAVFGDKNISHVALQGLNQRFLTYNLIHKILNIAGDLPRKGIYDTGLFKMITGGDNVMVERKYKDPIQASIKVKHIFSANELPQTQDKTYAFYRRWLIFIFPNTFEGDKADPFLLDKLIKELPGIFNWVLEGYKEFMETQDFAYPHTVEEIADMYEFASDSLSRFINEECEEEEGNMIIFSEFYKLYASFCKEHNLTPKADNMVGREIIYKAPYVVKTEKKIQGKKRNVLLNIRVNYIPPSDRENIIAEMERRFGNLEDFGEGDYILKRGMQLNGVFHRKGSYLKKGDLPEDKIKDLLKNGFLEEIGEGEGNG